MFSLRVLRNEMAPIFAQYVWFCFYIIIIIIIINNNKNHNNNNNNTLLLFFLRSFPAFNFKLLNDICVCVVANNREY